MSIQVFTDTSSLSPSDNPMVSIDFEWSQVSYLMTREDVDRIESTVTGGTVCDFNETIHQK